MKYILSITFFWGIFTTSFAQNNFKGKITYVRVINSELTKLKSDTFSVLFEDSVITTNYISNLTLLKDIKNIFSNTSVVYFKNKKDTNYQKNENSDKLSDLISDKKINDNDTLKILGSVCKLAYNKYNKFMEGKLANSSIEMKISYYLSDLKFENKNIFLDFDIIHNNGFGYIPLKIHTETEVSILDEEPIIKKSDYLAIKLERL